MKLTRAERHWNWHTWNLLLQISDATDGKDRRQVGGEMTDRGLCVASGRSDMRALHTRKWVKQIDVGELFNDHGDSRILPVWAITARGRSALAAATTAGVTIQ